MGTLAGVAAVASRADLPDNVVTLDQVLLNLI
jgi:hypothetical protein